MVLVTSGDLGGDAPARERESTAAAFALARDNVPAVPQFWSLPDADLIQRKRAAIHCFPSQLAVQDYGEQLLALNRFRSYTLGPGVSHAEAYQVLSSADLASGLAAALHNQGLAVQDRLGLRLVR